MFDHAHVVSNCTLYMVYIYKLLNKIIYLNKTIKFLCLLKNNKLNKLTKIYSEIFLVKNSHKKKIKLQKRSIVPHVDQHINLSAILKEIPECFAQSEKNLL